MPNVSYRETVKSTITINNANLFNLQMILKRFRIFLSLLLQRLLHVIGPHKESFYQCIIIFFQFDWIVAIKTFRFLKFPVNSSLENYWVSPSNVFDYIWNERFDWPMQNVDSITGKPIGNETQEALSCRNLWFSDFASETQNVTLLNKAHCLTHATVNEVLFMFAVRQKGIPIWQFTKRYLQHIYCKFGKYFPQFSLFLYPVKYSVLPSWQEITFLQTFTV